LLTVYHLAQGALACGVLAVTWRNARRILLDAPCDAKALTMAASELHSRSLDTELAALAGLCAPAWVAQAVSFAHTTSEPHAESDELIARLREELTASVRMLATLGRLSMALGFLVVLLELADALSGGHGLLALQRGLVERLALERAARRTRGRAGASAGSRR
jgi:hypothetical protein